MILPLSISTVHSPIQRIPAARFSPSPRRLPLRSPTTVAAAATSPAARSATSPAARSATSPAARSATSPAARSATAPSTPLPISVYDVLGINERATIREIRSAYRNLARVCHPDAAAAGDSSDEFLRLHAAYSTLADPTKRAKYDRELLAGRLAGDLAGRIAGGLCSQWPPLAYRFAREGRRRTWETDQCW